MADSDQQRDDVQGEEPALDLEVPEDDARSVEGGSVSNVLKTRHDTAKNSISN